MSLPTPVAQLDSQRSAAKNVTPLQADDLIPVLNGHHGTDIFSQALRYAREPRAFLRVLGFYIHFNAGFAAGVAGLAAQIAIRHSLFQDVTEQSKILSDRSVEVAAPIFFAAIDEFGNPTIRQATHRSLAQATFKMAALFFRQDPSILDSELTTNRDIAAIIERVQEGYGVGRMLDEPSLFRAIGFHLASETLAQREFETLDHCLVETQPAFAEYLKTAQVVINERTYPAYFWIQAHSQFEAEHSKAAWKGIEDLFTYYAGANDPAFLKNWILRGFADFAGLQTDFMRLLAG